MSGELGSKRAEDGGGRQWKDLLTEKEQEIGGVGDRQRDKGQAATVQNTDRQELSGRLVGR